MEMKRYARKFVLIYLVIIIAVGCYNFSLDPYYCYRITDRAKYFSWDQTESPTWKYGESKQYRGYDALWVGSSVSSHVDVDYVSSKMGVKCAASVQASGRPNIYERFIRNVLKHNDLRDAISDIKGICSFDKEKLKKVIDRVVVYGPDKIEIVWRAMDEVFGEITGETGLIEV